MHEPEFLLFASDATLLGLAGGALLLVAAVAFVGERRRLRRRHIDAVGWMPWTGVFFWALIVACVTLGLAAADWVKG